MLSPAYPEQMYPLSAEEAAAFGWSTPGQPLPLVLTTRTAKGTRMIPTRQFIDGEYHYGFIETRERPDYVEIEPWELAFGSEDEPCLGLLH